MAKEKQGSKHTEKSKKKMSHKREKTKQSWTPFIFGIILGSMGYYFLYLDKVFSTGMGVVFVFWGYKEILCWAWKAHQKAKKKETEIR